MTRRERSLWLWIGVALIFLGTLARQYQFELIAFGLLAVIVAGSVNTTS